MNILYILPQRFASILNEKAGDMECIALPPELHYLFTNAWRTAIPYGTTPKIETIYARALEIYAGFPKIIEVIKALA